MKKVLVSALLAGLLMATGCSSEPTNKATDSKQCADHTTKDSIYFEFDKKDVKPEYYNVLANAASELKKHNKQHVMLDIQGNTDDIGSDKYNDKLGKQRAEAIRKYLIKMGVKPSQINISSNGARNPVASNKDKAGRMKNRRGDITIKVCSLPKGFKSGDNLPDAK